MKARRAIGVRPTARWKQFTFLPSSRSAAAAVGRSARHCGDCLRLFDLLIASTVDELPCREK